MSPINVRQNHDHILHAVYQVAQENLRGLGVTLYLFGSWARQEEQSSSDIDLAILYEKSLPMGTLTQLRLAYEESNIPYRVEIVDLTMTDEDFRKKVLKEGVEWNV